VTLGVSILFLNMFHAITLWIIYQQMSVPAILFDNPRALLWVLKRIIPQLFVIQWLSFEIKALSRLFTGDDKFRAQISKSGKPTVAQILDRCQSQSFEQMIMTLGVCVSLSLVDLHPLDLRLPVAWAWTYNVGRPLFILGYLVDPVKGRLFGLFLGGFWANMGALLYCCWVASGFPQSITIAVKFYAGFFVIMTCVGVTVMVTAKPSKARGTEKVQ